MLTGYIKMGETFVEKKKSPVLVIMAAGMGSRYGGLKQIDPVDEQGDIIMDFSIYDAVRAGFKKVIFIIKKENEQIFREKIGDRIAKQIEVVYVFQELTKIPAGFSVPDGRVKPFGTGHAVLCCQDVLDQPFAVINADDYYGPAAFQMIYDFLISHDDDEQCRFTMVGYRLGNTLTENGHVSRGVCSVDSSHYLTGIKERTFIVMTPDGAAFSEDDGKTFTDISPEETVSMNMWGFSENFVKYLGAHFEEFMKNELPGNPLKAEFYLPSAVSRLLSEGKATVEVLRSEDKWYGVTYKEDKEMVMAAVSSLKKKGIYPEILWS